MAAQMKAKAYSPIVARRNDCLEEKRDRARHAGEKAPNTAAEGEEAQEQRADSEEDGDEHEREHEPCQVVKRISTIWGNQQILQYWCSLSNLPLKSSWHALGRPKIALRVKWICRANLGADIGSAGAHTADIPKSPSRLSRRTRYPRSVGLKEIDCIDRARVDSTSKEDEEYENAGTGDQD
ncbi:hypothetical protein MMC11_004504 [Xylographa trunciseda]|nr:hypothetical protein [Xylographa trunciseda]